MRTRSALRTRLSDGKHTGSTEPARHYTHACELAGVHWFLILLLRGGALAWAGVSGFPATRFLSMSMQKTLEFQQIRLGVM